MPFTWLALLLLCQAIDAGTQLSFASTVVSVWILSWPELLKPSDSFSHRGSSFVHRQSSTRPSQMLLHVPSFAEEKSYVSNGRPPVFILGCEKCLQSRSFLLSNFDSVQAEQRQRGRSFRSIRNLCDQSFSRAFSRDIGPKSFGSSTKSISTRWALRHTTKSCLL